MNSSTVYCIYSFNEVTDKCTIHCVVAEKEKALESLDRLAVVFEQEQFFMESVLFFS